MSLVRSSKTTPAVCCFCRIETLGYFEDTEAKKLLENVARKFYPRNRNLFGLHINEGEEIKVRLREPENVKTLLPFESVVGTILHELAHFVHKKHDKSFYLLLDQLTTEYEACFVGFGKGNFNSDKGQRIGGKISKPSTKQEKRNLLAQAAETRRIRAGLLCGAQKLGGSSPQSSSTPQQMAVLAAIRRMKDQERCGTVDS